MGAQRGTIKTYALSGKTATEAYKLFKEAYREKAYGQTMVFRLFKVYKNDRGSIQDMRGSFPKVTIRTPEKVAMIKKLVMEDSCKSITDSASESGQSVGMIHTILHDDLGLSEKVAHWVTCLLSDEYR